MGRLDEFLSKINFKKITKVYIITAISIIIICFAAILFVTKDKIFMALDYKKASDIFEKQGIGDVLNSQLKKLSSDSKDIVNIVAVDKDNKVIFKANDNVIGKNNNLSFNPYESNKKYLYSNINNDILYRIVKADNLLLNLGYIQNNDKLSNDIDEEFSYEKDFSGKTIYFLNYMINKKTNDKIFIIRDVAPIPYAENLVETMGTLLGIIFMIYWIGLALWVYKDANEKRTNASLWGMLVLLINLGGLIVYFIYKQSNIVCFKCGTMQDKENIFCNHCGIQLHEKCDNCSNIIAKGSNYCHKCGHKI
jgi:hypothetical protein